MVVYGDKYKTCTGSIDSPEMNIVELVPDDMHSHGRSILDRTENLLFITNNLILIHSVTKIPSTLIISSRRKQND